MIQNFFKGTSYPFTAIGFIFRHPRLGKFILFPFLINVALFLAGFFFFISKIDTLLQSVPGNEAWYFAILYYFLAALLIISFLVLTFYAFTLFGNLIASPFNSALSEKVEEIKKQRALNRPFNLKMILQDAYRAVSTEIKRLGLFILIFIPIFLLNLIPVIGQVVYVVLMIFLTAWGLSFTFMDYILERKMTSFRQKLGVIFAQKSLSLGFGLICFLFGLIPILNLFLIPVCVTAGTLMYLNEIEPITNRATYEQH